MDMVKMGSFLAELRKEHNLTQTELGEKLGVSNKTISRWETGTYMPPVEMLAELSELYGLTINELISGRKLDAEEYKEVAESNIKETLEASAFTLKDKQSFWRKKWIRKNIFTFILCGVLWLSLILSMKALDVDSFVVSGVAGMVVVFYYIILNNRMMSYVEKHVFGNPTKKIAISTFDNKAVIVCQEVKASRILAPGKRGPKFVLSGIDKITLGGEHSTILGWYETSEDVQKEIAEITDALNQGKASYTLKYSADVELVGVFEQPRIKK